MQLCHFVYSIVFCFHVYGGFIAHHLNGLGLYNIIGGKCDVL